MASIGELNSRINALRAENKELQKEFDEYTNLKNDLSNLVEAHISCRRRDLAVLNGANLLPSRSVQLVISELRAKLSGGPGQALAGNASSLAGTITRKQMKIEKQISDNEGLITHYGNQIRLLNAANKDTPPTNAPKNYSA